MTHADHPEPVHGIRVSPLLTCHPEKQRLYGADTYYQESYEQLAALTDDATGFAHRHAALLLKPDAVVARRLDAAVEWLAEQDFRIVGAAITRLTRTMIRSLWYFQWNLATPTAGGSPRCSWRTRTPSSCSSAPGATATSRPRSASPC